MCNLIDDFNVESESHAPTVTHIDFSKVKIAPNVRAILTEFSNVRNWVISPA